MATRELSVQVRMDGLEDVRRVEHILMRIRRHLDAIEAQSERLGIPITALLDGDEEKN